MKLLRRAVLAIAFLAAPALAHHDGEIFAQGDIRVSHAWIEAPGGMAHAVEVYLTVANIGVDADRLVSVRTGFTQPGVIQAAILDADGALEVREVPAVNIAPGQSVTFQPGGIRIVLNDVQRPLEPGHHFDMVLEFAKAGTLEIEVEIERRDEEGAPGA